MKNHFNNLWRRLENISTSEKDPPAEKRRKVTLVLIAILCCFTGIVAGTRSCLISDPIKSVLIPYLFATVVGLAVLLFFLTKKFPILLYSFLFMILLIPAFFNGR